MLEISALIKFCKYKSQMHVFFSSNSAIQNQLYGKVRYLYIMQH